MTSNVISRVKSALAYLKKYEGLTANDISKKSKISKPTLAQFKAGHGKPRSSTLRKLQKAFPFINNEWLTSGNGEMIIEEKLPNQINMPIMKRIRLHLGLTQKELAQKVGINQGLISHYERTGKNLSKKIVVKLNQIYQSELEEILSPKSPIYDQSVEKGNIVASKGSEDFHSLFGISFDAHVVCSGNAMAPRFNRGDVLLLKHLHTDSLIPFGECFYLEMEEIDLLRVIEHEENNQYILRSANATYVPLTIDKSDIKNINLVVGRVEPLA